MAQKVYRVAVIGCPRTVLDPTKLEIGVGKSCFCCRFIKPEAYAEEHPFAITDEQWNGPTVNRDQFLYWGAVSRNIPGLHRARFQVIEHTEFVNNSSWHPYPCSPKDYISRVVDSTLTSEGKIAYKGQSRKYQPSPPAIYGRSSLGSHQTSTQIFPSEDFRVNGIVGYVCLYDPTVPLETGAMQNQLDFLSELLKAVNKSKKRCILVCTKSDAAKEDAIRMGQKLAAPYKKNIPFIECSARENVNVNEAFFSLAIICKKKHFSRASQLSLRSLTYKDACNSKKREKNQIINTYKAMLWKKVKSFDTTWHVAEAELQNEIDFPLIKEIAGDDLMKKLFCQRLMEIKVEEASKKFGRVAKHSSSLTDSLKKEQCKEYQDFLLTAFTEHPDLGNTAMQSYCVATKSESEPSLQTELLASLPPTPISLDKLDNCFSDLESEGESELLPDDTASELEVIKSDPILERSDSFATAKPNMQVLAKPMRSTSTQIKSPRLPDKSISTVKSTMITLDPSLSRSEEQLWKKSKSTSAAVDKRNRFSSDAFLDENRPPLPPRTYYADPKIVSKPLPPIPTEEEEFIPSFANRRKLSSSMDCLINPTLEEEPSPYISPIELQHQLKVEDQSKLTVPSSSHLSDRPPLPAIPRVPPSRPITRSFTQYIPGKKYGHKRSRSSNCDFLKSLPKDEKPYNIHKGTRSSLNPYATLGPSSFVHHSMRAKSGSPPESDLEGSFKKKNSSKLKSSMQSLVLDETDQDSFGTYTRMSPAPSLDLRISVSQSQELLRDQSKPPNDNSSDVGITECASAVPPRRGQRRKARRWEISKDGKNQIKYNSANRLYWQQRHQAFEAPRYVSHPSSQHNSLNINIQRHETDSHTGSKRSSCDSNIYEHVDEDVLDDLRRSRNGDYRSSAETDMVYKSNPQPGVFPHPPTAQEWHYFMYMWRLFLQWMSEHAPPEVYSVPSNIPANVGNTPPLIGNHTLTETIDKGHKESITSYTSIDCEWIKNIAKTRTSTLVEDVASSSQGYSDNTEASTVVNKHASLRSQNSQATLYDNGKSVSSVDSGICHSQNDDTHSNGDS